MEDLTLCFHKMPFAISVGETEARRMEEALDPLPCHHCSFLEQIFAPLWFGLICFAFSSLSFAHLLFTDDYFFGIHFFTGLFLHSCYYFLIRSFPQTPLSFIWLILQGSAFLMEIFLNHRHPVICFHSALCLSFLTLTTIT